MTKKTTELSDPHILGDILEFKAHMDKLNQQLENLLGAALKGHPMQGVSDWFMGHINDITLVADRIMLVARESVEDADDLNGLLAYRPSGEIVRILADLASLNDVSSEVVECLDGRGSA